MVETARPLFHRTSAEQEFRSRLVTCRSVSRIYSATQRSRQSHSRNRPPNQKFEDESSAKMGERLTRGPRRRTEASLTDFCPVERKRHQAGRVIKLNATANRCKLLAAIVSFSLQLKFPFAKALAITLPLSPIILAFDFILLCQQ